MQPKGLVVFEYILRNQTNNGKGGPPVDMSLSTLLEQWQRLPEGMKAECENLETQMQEKKRGMISAQHSSHQPQLQNTSPSIDNIPAGSTIPDIAAAPAMTQHFSSPSPSTTPSPSTASLSPSPFCPLQPDHHHPRDIYAAPPITSQPGPLNIGDNWPSVQYGARPKVAFLIENQPPPSSGGRHTTATNHHARPHPYASPGTTVPAPPLHGGQGRIAQTAPLRRTQTVVLGPAARTTPAVAGAPNHRGNLRRFQTAPTLVSYSNPTHTARMPRQPLVHAAPATSSGQQLAHPTVRDRRISAGSVEGVPAVTTGARQPPPSPLYASVAPHAAPAPQMQAPMPTFGSPRVPAPSAEHRVHMITTHDPAVPLPSSFNQPLPAEAESTTAASPVASAPREIDMSSWQTVNTGSFMELLRRIPTPPLDIDFSPYVDDILGPQVPPLPDAFQIWPPGHWSEYRSSSLPSGWEDFIGFPEQ